MTLALLLARRERLTAKQATLLAVREFGPQAFAEASGGTRTIWLRRAELSSVSCLGTGSTWSAAFSQARLKAAHTHECRTCGRCFSAAEWLALEFCGVQEIPFEEPLVLRNCTCGSTLAKPLSEEEALKK